LVLVFQTAIYGQKSALLYNKGLKFLDQEKDEKAIACFKKSIKADQNFKPSYVILGILAGEKQEFLSARSYFKRAVEIDNTDSGLYYYLGNVYSHLNRNDSAVFYYEKSLFLEPENLLTLFELGNVNYGLKNFAVSAAYLKKCHDLGFKKTELNVLLASAYAGLEDAENTRKYADLSIDQNGETNDALRLRGYSRYLLDDLDGAYFDLEKSIGLSKQKDTVDYYAMFYMGLVNLRLKQYSEAIINFSNSEVMLKEANVYYNRGLVKKYLTDYDGAIVDFKKALEIKPLYAEALDELVRLYVFAGDEDEAFSLVERSIQEGPYEASNYFLRAQLLYEVDSIGAAIASLDKAIELDASYLPAYTMRALYKYDYFEDQLIDRPDYEDLTEEEEDSIIAANQKDIEADFDKALSFKMDEDYIYYQRGIYYFMDGYYTKAIEDFKRLTDNPDYLTSSNYYLGRCYQEVNHHKQAIEHFQKAIELEEEKENAEIYYYISISYYKTKQQEKFCFFIRKAIALGYETTLEAKCAEDR
jgi:tetratricopeptide (TPR) repeat protein